MKACSAILFSLALAVCFVTPTWAQQPGGTSAAGATAPSTGMALFKIAIIEMETFFDPGKGITSVVRAIEGLDQEFGPLKKEMQDMEQRYQTLVEEIARATSSTDSRALQGKRFRAESLRRELRNKAEDVEEAFMERLEQVLGPIEDDLRKAIASYAGHRGISLVIDLDRARDLILYVDASANATHDFINEYNRNAPAQASPVKRPGN